MAQTPKAQKMTTKHLQIQKASSTVFIAVAVASVIISISLVFLNILWGTYSYNNKVHGVQEEARDTLESNITAVEDLQSSFEILEIGAPLIPDQDTDKKNSELVLDALPSKFDYPGLASSIDNLAKTSSVTVVLFDGVDLGSDAEQFSTSPQPIAIPFSLNVEGPYDSITSFLVNMERSIRPFKILSVQLSGTDANIRAELEVETYYQPAFDLNTRTQEVR